jgi:hypothetical protein
MSAKKPRTPNPFSDKNPGNANENTTAVVIRRMTSNPYDLRPLFSYRFTDV